MNAMTDKQAQKVAQLTQALHIPPMNFSVHEISYKGERIALRGGEREEALKDLREMVLWRCRICNQEFTGDDRETDRCPYCNTLNIMVVEKVKEV